jgi:cysteine desulfurase
MNVYLDNAATTRMRPEVRQAMEPYLGEVFGNPSSIHAFGRKARKALEEAREIVAAAISAKPSEIVFTSGGTEADNAAVFGVLAAAACRKPHVVTTAIEHHAVLHACEFAKVRGCEVTYVYPDRSGIVAPDAVEAAIRPETVLVSVMLVNNETGAVQPVRDIAARAKKYGVPVHTDAVQALSVIDLNVVRLGVDLLTLSSHKVHGPKGVGALYVRRGTRWNPVLFGGAQERGRRPGTENVPGIAGFGEAVRLLLSGRDEARRHMAALKKAMLGILRQQDRDVVVNGPEEGSVVPSILNVSFPGLAAETILMNLDLAGVAASAGSACTSGSLQPSHVLQAMGLPKEVVKSAIRFSFSEQNTMEETMYAAEKTVEIVLRLRQKRSGI